MGAYRNDSRGARACRECHKENMRAYRKRLLVDKL
jgi:hypothetical protein